MKLAPLFLILLLSACSNLPVVESEIAIEPEPKGFKAIGLEDHAIIDPHLDAYNSNDYKSFRSLFHEEIEVYDFPNTLLFKGMDNFDKTYEVLVSKISKSAFISKRIIEGNFVVDMESVKFQLPDANGKVIEVLVIYQIKDNLIYRMMFLMDT